MQEYINRIPQIGSFLSGIAHFGFITGMVFIAASTFGAEFQQRTLQLLLTQPESRLRIWRDKLLVAAITIGAISIFDYLALKHTHFFKPDESPPAFLIPLFVLTVVCSTALWTLLARSTIGGIVFTFTAFFLITGATSLIAEKLFGLSDLPMPESNWAVYTIATLVGVTYSAICLWIGWRKFASIEVRDNTGSDDISLPFSIPVSTFIADALRCRSQGLLANLVRKELRLHKIIFLSAGLFSVCWLATLLLFFVFPQYRTTFEGIFNGLTATYMLIATILAGCISLSEERSLGVAAWHLTLPAAPLLQWFIKLAVGLMVCCVAVISLPLLLAWITTIKAQVGLLVYLRQVDDYGKLFLITGLFYVLSFWAASITGNAVRALLTAVLLSMGLGISASAGQSLAQWLAGAETRLMVEITTGFGWNPYKISTLLSDAKIIIAPMFIIPVAAIIQSIRGYRKDKPTDGIPIKQILVLVVLTFTSVTWLMDIVRSSSESASHLHNVLGSALRDLRIDPSQLPAYGERQKITVDQLPRAASLDPTIRSWLGKTPIELYWRAGSRTDTRLYPMASVMFSDGAVPISLPPPHEQQREIIK